MKQAVGGGSDSDQTSSSDSENERTSPNDRIKQLVQKIQASKKSLEQIIQTSQAILKEARDQQLKDEIIKLV